MGPVVVLPLTVVTVVPVVLLPPTVVKRPALRPLMVVRLTPTVVLAPLVTPAPPPVVRAVLLPVVLLATSGRVELSGHPTGGLPQEGCRAKR